MTAERDTDDQPQPSQTVSDRTAKRLRDAMDRLLAGRPQRTNGRLIKDNLWKEADVSRATMNRATQIMAEWDARFAACDGFTPREARKNDELTILRDDLAAKTRECTKLSHQLDAAATVIAALHHDNTLLRQELGQHGEIIALNAAPHRDNVTSHQRTGLSARRAPADHSLSTLKPRNPDVS